MLHGGESGKHWSENEVRYSVRMRENTDRNNSEYGHFSSRIIFVKIIDLENVLTKFIGLDALGTRVAFKVFKVVFERLWEMPLYTVKSR